MSGCAPSRWPGRTRREPQTADRRGVTGAELAYTYRVLNFPRFGRNLNTGGRNFDEAKGVVAKNAVHHSKQYPSSIIVTVVKSYQ